MFLAFVVDLFTFQNWFKSCRKRFFGKVNLFAHSLGEKEAIILCSFNFDLKRKI